MQTKSNLDVNTATQDISTKYINRCSHQFTDMHTDKRPIYENNLIHVDNEGNPFSLLS